MSDPKPKSSGTPSAASSELDPDLLDKIRALKEKYGTTGQDLPAYLEGLLYTDYLNYWDYIHLDALLGLQTPRTEFPDEMVFIVYHQTTELYFKLVRWEQEQLADDPHLTAETFLMRLERMNRYFKILITSFEVMVEGMEPAQFRKFRMALLPASGFQSVQYRLIELASTDLINLVNRDQREGLRGASLEAMYQEVYWKRGATELATGDETLTLQHFERKYRDELLRTAHRFQEKNLWQKYLTLDVDDVQRETVKVAMRAFDLSVNVTWPMAHLRSAGKYLHREPEVIAATGGTNWQKYLPPRFQQRIFFPELWEESERSAWGTRAMSNEKRNGYVASSEETSPKSD
ncbi:tryptophan 2,3-dioxygenase [Catalinimonas alkaloidigena]|uniref:Tryptophan 2,3-dioxygenase n=1 Tax=Catalinimonas alkaloidigena TaxID=1075417 RepID=A0A1G9KUA9_9BACT|nr:tryptophan 2,3-dioxygenase family protein [Catalinimonas alkaloidigena]SDL53301.1 tryptophan 2,3-dioxygenase [Catalinimonas alkaloidigena]